MNKGCTGTFEEFVKGNISILVPSVNSKEYCDLMQKCEEAHLKWASWDAPTAFTPPTKCDEELRIQRGEWGLTYSTSVGNASLPEIKYKKLTFATPDTYELHISCRDGKITHAIYKKNGEVVERSEARCCSGDTFNFTKGAVIAMSKLAAVQVDTSALLKKHIETLFPLGKGLVHRCNCSEE